MPAHIAGKPFCDRRPNHAKRVTEIVWVPLSQRRPSQLQHNRIFRSSSPLNAIKLFTFAPKGRSLGFGRTCPSPTTQKRTGEHWYGIRLIGQDEYAVGYRPGPTGSPARMA